MIKSITKGFEANESDLEKINQFSRRPLSADEVFTFSVILCDNEVDRDFERFTINTLSQLADLFVGKTGIFDHDPKGKNQSARIFETEVFTDNEKVTSAGEPYTCVKAKAYMVKSSKFADLMLEIDAGIKKEVSVSCSVKSRTCSVCGKAPKACSHQKGSLYSKVICHHILDNATDAYEWSFVAVPAQKNAGVTKSFKYQNFGKEVFNMDTMHNLIKSFADANEDIVISCDEAKAFALYEAELLKSAEIAAEYKLSLEKDVRRLSFLSGEFIPSAVMDSLLKKMDLAELQAFQKAYSTKLMHEENAAPQLANSDFKNPNFKNASTADYNSPKHSNSSFKL